MLKMILDNLDGLDANLASLYEAQADGKFRLQLEGYEDPAALLRAKNHEKQQRQAAEQKTRELQEQIEQLQEQIDGLGDDKHRKKGDVAALEQSYKDKIEKLKADHAKELAGRDAQISKLLVDNVADSMAAELSDAPELLSDIIRKRLTVKDGETRVLNADGEMVATTVDELKEEIRSNKKYAAVIRGSQGSGGGSGGGR